MNKPYFPAEIIRALEASNKVWKEHEEINGGINLVALGVKLDSLGRKRHPKQENNRVKEYHATYGLRMDREMMNRLKAKCKGKHKVAELIRTYIEWGLENEE